MYKRILVPVDGSDTSMRGLGEAVAIARQSGGQLCLFHVVNELVLDYPYSARPSGMTLVDSLRDLGNGILKRAEDLAAKQGLTVESVLFEDFGGSAADPIVAQARKWNADLILMGTHGHVVKPEAARKPRGATS